MASVASQLIEEVTAHAERDCLDDVREVCADGTYFPNNLCTWQAHPFIALYTTEVTKHFESSVRVHKSYIHMACSVLLFLLQEYQQLPPTLPANNQTCSG